MLPHAEPWASPRPAFELLLVDNDDCFIHTLANYARQTGAEVVTYRAGFPLNMIDEAGAEPDSDLAGSRPPVRFRRAGAGEACADRSIPVFGVCLGLQGIVEAFGGELGVLDYPMHGKPSVVDPSGKGVFEGLPSEFQVGRYHSLYAAPGTLPACLEVTAETDDGVIMGVRHRDLADRGRAVPSGIDALPGWFLWNQADAERGSHPRGRTQSSRRRS